MKKDITLEKREVFTPEGVKMREGEGSNIIEGVAIVTNKVQNAAEELVKEMFPDIS